MFNLLNIFLTILKLGGWTSTVNKKLPVQPQEKLWALFWFKQILNVYDRLLWLHDPG